MKKILAIVAVCMLALVGCNSTNDFGENIKPESSEEEATGLQNDVINEAVNEVINEVINEESSMELSDTGVLRWEHIGGTYTQRKLVKNNEDTFVEDFILQYVDELPEEKLITNISRYYAVEYPLNEKESIFVFREDVEGGTIVICVYYDKSQSKPYTDSDLTLTDYPSEEDEDYTFTTEEFPDLKIVSYVYSGEINHTDVGNMYYDSTGHLMVWDHYLTSGCRQMYFVWDGDGIAMIIDTGGQAADILADDEDISIGMHTVIYVFEEPVAFEDISF